MNKLVSIITRTKNRAIFIPRVFETVVQQSYRPIEWIIVNDNGESIDNLLAELKPQYKDQLDGIEIVIINKKVSTGRGGACKTGQDHAHGFYITLLDDDDTFDASSIEKQIYYMENKKLPNERGVMCYTKRIYEKVEDNKILTLKTINFDRTPKNITIVNLAERNQFTVHSFLYERNALEYVGTYNEILDILEDWEFNLRFIMKFDIGVLPEFLVNHHIREEGMDRSTIVNQAEDYERYRTMIYNQFIRNEKEYPGITSIISNYQISKSEQIKLRDEVISNNNKQIKLRDEVISNNNKQIKLRDEVILKNNEQIKSQEEIILKKNEQMKSRDEAISDNNKQIKLQDEVILRKNEQMKSRDEAISNKNKQIKSQNEVITNRTLKIDSFKDELTLIYLSKSWNLTRPLRKLRKLQGSSK